MQHNFENLRLRLSAGLPFSKICNLEYGFSGCRLPQTLTFGHLCNIISKICDSGCLPGCDIGPSYITGGKIKLMLSKNPVGYHTPTGLVSAFISRFIIASANKDLFLNKLRYVSHTNLAVFLRIEYLGILF